MAETGEVLFEVDGGVAIVVTVHDADQQLVVMRLDPRGRLATIYYGENWEPEHLLRDILHVLRTSNQAADGSQNSLAVGPNDLVEGGVITTARTCAGTRPYALTMRASSVGRYSSTATTSP